MRKSPLGIDMRKSPLFIDMRKMDKIRKGNERAILVILISSLWILLFPQIDRLSGIYKIYMY